MHEPDIPQVASDLFEWCRRHDFAGHDPFDALNSRLFQATPLKHFAAARILWTQLIKRSPVDLRRLALVPVQRNAKGIALFALASLSNHRRLLTEETETQARDFLENLLEMKLSGWSGASWGYNFDWQSRALFAPRGTPAIVPSAFAARALIEGARLFNDNVYLNTARSTCDFILNDLKRSWETESEICFSYTPNCETRIYNASLLAAETLAAVGSLTGEKELLYVAACAARYVVRQQQANGSWTYGAAQNQSWVDSFHTAYLLSSLGSIMKHCSDEEGSLEPALRRGYEYWRAAFFLADGWPKYYHHRLYPVDTHAAAAAIVTLLDLSYVRIDALQEARKIARWSIRNLRNDAGFFYYQRRRYATVRTPFMRWTQAWMLYALARLLEEDNVGQNHRMVLPSHALASREHSSVC